jgi:hypothetical protein
MHFIVPFLTALLSLIFFIAGRRYFQRYRLYSGTPTSRIAELRPGFAEAKGRLVSKTSLIAAPMSGALCVYWRFEVEELRKRGKNRSWVSMIDESKHVPCAIDDGTGRADISWSGAELLLKVDVHQRSGFLNDAPPHLEQLLRERNMSSTGRVFNKSLRYRETTLVQGDEMYVLGTVGWGKDGPAFSAGGPAYVLSDQSEGKLASAQLATAIALLSGAVLVLAGAALIAYKMWSGSST